MTLALLQLEDPFFHRVTCNQAIREHVAALTDAVRPIDRLGFDRRVPPRIEQKDVLRGGEIQSQAAGFQTDQKQPAGGIGLETLHLRLTILGPAIEVFVCDAGGVQSRAEECEEARELRKYERLVPFFDRFRHPRHEHVQLGRCVVRVTPIDEARMTRRLSKAQQCFEHLQLLTPESVPVRALEQRLPIMRAQFVVNGALRPFELAVERLFVP